MKTLVASLMVVVAACSGSQKSPGPVSGQSEVGSIGALDSVVADLEAMRPFVVVKDNQADCAAYAPSATEIIAKLALHVPDADSARKNGGDAIAQWQTAHKATLEKLLAEVVVPTRNVTGCAAMETDETWRKTSRAFVAVAEPAVKPAPVLARAAVMDELLAGAGTLTSKDDCKKLQGAVMAKHPTLEADYKAMSPIEQFVDDVVWEEQDEQRMKDHPNAAKMIEFCF